MTTNTDALLPDEAYKKLLEFTELNAVKIEASNVYESISMQTMHNDRLARAFPSLLALATYYAVKADTRTPQPSAPEPLKCKWCCLGNETAHHPDCPKASQPSVTSEGELAEIIDRIMVGNSPNPYDWQMCKDAAQAILTAFHVSRKE